MAPHHLQIILLSRRRRPPFLSRSPYIYICCGRTEDLCMYWVSTFLHFSGQSSNPYWRVSCWKLHRLPQLGLSLVRKLPWQPVGQPWSKLQHGWSLLSVRWSSESLSVLKGLFMALERHVISSICCRTCSSLPFDSFSQSVEFIIIIWIYVFYSTSRRRTRSHCMKLYRRSKKVFNCLCN